MLFATSVCNTRIEQDFVRGYLPKLPRHAFAEVISIIEGDASHYI
jgi:hypothetical protein